MTDKNRVHKAKKPIRILAKDVTVKADERALQNLNTLCVGCSGAGKTRSFVSPNISSSTESMVVIDSKLNLFGKHKKELEDKGYQVELIDLCNLSNSSIGYNPMDLIRKKEDDSAVIDDVKELASLICADEEFQNLRDGFWQSASRDYISACISMAIRLLIPKEHNLTYVSKILNYINSPEWNALIAEAKLTGGSDCLEVTVSRQIQDGLIADRMGSSILAMCKSAIQLFNWEGSSELYSMKRRIKFTDLGEKKTAVFLNVPDHDYSKVALVRLFFSQCLKSLLDHADKQKNSMLKEKVHIFCDDIGANFVIPHLPELIAITRSRGISLSLMLQSVDQLYSKYGIYDANAIIANCSSMVLLAGNTDYDTANFFSNKANIPIERIIEMSPTSELVCLQNKCFIATKHNEEDFRPIEYTEEPAAELERDCDERGEDYGKEVS